MASLFLGLSDALELTCQAEAGAFTREPSSTVLSGAARSKHQWLSLGARIADRSGRGWARRPSKANAPRVVVDFCERQVKWEHAGNCRDEWNCRARKKRLAVEPATWWNRSRSPRSLRPLRRSVHNKRRTSQTAAIGVERSSLVDEGRHASAGLEGQRGQREGARTAGLHAQQRRETFA